MPLKDINKSMHDGALLVVSPPSAPDLTSLLTGHIGRDGGAQGAYGAAEAVAARNTDAAAVAVAMHINGSKAADTTTKDCVKSSPKKKTKKSKTPKEKVEKSSKRDRSGTALKPSTFKPLTPVVQPPANK